MNVVSVILANLLFLLSGLCFLFEVLVLFSEVILRRLVETSYEEDYEHNEHEDVETH